MKILFWALVVSASLNLVLGVGMKNLNHRLDKVQGELTVSREAARQCSEATAKLQEEARKRAKEAEAAIERARRQAGDHNKRADRHLSTPPTRPGDDCGSARDRIDNWWAEEQAR